MLNARTGAILLLTLTTFSLHAADEAWIALIAPANSWDYFLLKNDKPVLKAALMAWGQRWEWVNAPQSKARAADGVLKLSGKLALNGKKDTLTTAFEGKKGDEKTLVYRYDLSADKDTNLTMLAVGFSVMGPHTGQAVLKLSTGTEKNLPLPLKRGENIADVASIEFQLKDAGNVVLKLDPPCTVMPEEHVLRVMLAHDKFPAGSNTVTLSLTTPESLNFVAQDLSAYVKTLPGPDWFEFKPANDSGESAISMNDWLEKPAGKHGGVRMNGDHFEFTDGTPVKFWGTNLCYRECTPWDKKSADRTAARFAKYGINGIRLHKFTYAGGMGIGDANDGTKLTTEGLDHLDYFCSKLTENGIYYGFSHTYGYEIRPGDKARLLAYDEIKKNLQGKTYGFINIAEDVQDIVIEMVVNLLKHKNAYTGKTYAEDPALSYIELQNEDDIFFYTSDHAINACPTYKKDLMKRFSDWLKAKYGTREALAAAWGSSLKPDEGFDAQNFAIQGNPWFMGSDGLAQQKDNPQARQRLLDNAAFLHSVQEKFYTKFVKAIRDAGYAGPICGSPWQAPGMLPHYYNLRSDYNAGWIDRHNYFGSKLSDTTLRNPGSGILSTGLQQVVDRPFGVSEWIHVYPDLYNAEGPAIMAAYGMGLQGWDASYEFQSSSSRATGFDTIVGNFPWGVWDADTPTQIGQFPTLSRMILRGDVTQGQTISTRRVSPQDLATGTFNFDDTIAQSHDVKTFTGSVPAAALAAGRCVVEFTDKTTDSVFADLTKYDKDKTITSATGQLKWDYSNDGIITINTDGTKGVIGFAEGHEFDLGGVKVAIHSPYVSLLVTAAEKGATLVNSKSALISAVSRNSNSGFTYFTVDQSVLENGKGPILLEPVKARVAFTRPIDTVTILDHDGRRTDRKADIQDNGFVIDGTKDKALYYEVTFK